jgi:hypothetical protein
MYISSPLEKTHGFLSDFQRSPLSLKCLGIPDLDAELKQELKKGKVHCTGKNSGWLGKRTQ